jgi:hypothetical protein
LCRYVAVDLNRNWGVAFGAEPGSSGDSCAESYRGPEVGLDNLNSDESRLVATLAPVK